MTAIGGFRKIKIRGEEKRETLKQTIRQKGQETQARREEVMALTCLVEN